MSLVHVLQNQKKLLNKAVDLRQAKGQHFAALFLYWWSLLIETLYRDSALFSFCHLAELRTPGVLYFKHYKIKEYRVFFFSAILIFENSPYILELQIMPI